MHTITHRRRPGRIGLLALASLCAAAPAGFAHAENTARLDTAMAAPTGVSDTAFEAGFARFDRVPRPHQPAAHAVDVTAIEPPVEVEPAARPLGTGTASYYGRRFHGRRTASGAPFDMNAMTAAHRTLPFGSKVRVTNPGNGRSVTVTINDRGPFHGGRVIDVSRAAATELGLIRRGHGTVELALLD